MRTTAAAMILSLAAVARLPSPVAARRQTPRFHSDSSELVVLPVTVTDRHGQPVADLTRAQFAVFDNGRRQSIARTSTLKDVLARARLSNVVIYTIGIFDGDDPDANPRALKDLAEATAGERVLPDSAGPLLGACARIAREIRAGYTIAFVPPDQDGIYHRVRVDVDVTGQSLVVRTRPGYFAGAASSRSGR